MRTALICVGLLLPVASLHSQAMKGNKPHAAHAAAMASVFMPDGITWGPAPGALPAGATAAVLEGNPMKGGPFTMRLHMPAGYRIPPHFHPATEHVTVISGSLKFGMGDTFDEGQMKAVPAGTFAAIPPRMHHFAMAESETVLQLHGMGPWRIVYVNRADDPRMAKDKH